LKSLTQFASRFAQLELKKTFDQTEKFLNLNIQFSMPPEMVTLEKRENRIKKDHKPFKHG
jgi:hypothetical protein